ncbi:hypothetical protein HYY75_12475 [bacterium]|nr:hypothetical protein [bacterium]
MAAEVKCPQCGFQVISGQELCRNCGSRLVGSTNCVQEDHESAGISATGGEPTKPVNLEKATPNLNKPPKSEETQSPPNFDQAFYLKEPLPQEKVKRRIFTIIDFLIIMVVFAVLAAIAVPNFKCYARPQSREKACYANMRVILGAIEMYNMDNSAWQNTMNSNVEGQLVSGGYLKNQVSKPDINCDYGATGDLTQSGKVVCQEHGTVD